MANVPAVTKEFAVPERRLFVALKTAGATKMAGDETKVGEENNSTEEAIPSPSWMENVILDDIPMQLQIME